MREDEKVNEELENAEAVPLERAAEEEAGNEKEEEEDKVVTQHVMKSESSAVSGVGKALSACEFPIGVSHEDEDEQPLQDEDPGQSPQMRKKSNPYRIIPSGAPYSPGSITTMEIGLAKDTYSMMIVAPFNTQAWWIAFFTFIVQFILFIMIFGSQVESSRDSSYFNAPARVSTFTRCAQFLAISVLFIFQKDLADSILLITMFITDENREHHLRTLIKTNIEFEEKPNKYWREFQKRILYPNLCKLLQGFFALLTSFVIVIQSSDVIELFKDFSALSVISTVSIVVYRLIGDGLMLGSATKVQTVIRDIENISFTRHIKQRCRVPLQRIVMGVVFLILYILWGTVVNHQVSGRYFKQKYPRCTIPKADHHKLGDGKCDGGLLSHIDCDFDGGDCISYLLAWPECYADEPFRIGNGECDLEYNKDSCGWDGGDCCNARTREEKLKLGDGTCDEEFNNDGCSFDKGGRWTEFL